MSPTGTNPTYVSASGCGHIPLPRAGDTYLRTHEVKPKTSSIDWDAIRAANQARLQLEGHTAEAARSKQVSTQVPCTVCGTRVLDAVDGICDTCTTDTQTRFEVPAPVPVTVDVAPPVAIKAARVKVQRTRKPPATPKTPKAERPPREPRATPDSSVDVTEATRLYYTGRTCAQIGDALGHTVGTIRNKLKEARVTMRDDRSTNSGGGNRIDAYPATLVADVCHLYTVQGLSQSEVAEQLGVTQKVVYNVMRLHNIPARKGQTGRVDGAAGLKARIAASGATSADIKAWATSVGLPGGDKHGIPSAVLVTAYEQAHHLTQGATP